MPFFKRFRERTSFPAYSLIAKPTCPVCEGETNITLIAPVLTGSEIDEVTYSCAKCDHEFIRTVRHGTRL